MNYELAKKLKDAGFLQDYHDCVGDSSGNCICDNDRIIRDVTIPTLTELIEEIKKMRNEVAIGWNDSGCFWHFQYGERVGETYDALDSDTLKEAVANLWLKLKE